MASDWLMVLLGVAGGFGLTALMALRLRKEPLYCSKCETRLHDYFPDGPFRGTGGR